MFYTNSNKVNFNSILKINTKYISMVVDNRIIS